jgi:chemotaxis protein methyltransferase CheR
MLDCDWSSDVCSSDLTQERVWNRFAPLVAPGGRLYVGHSERVGSSITAFESCGLTAYRKVGR